MSIFATIKSDEAPLPSIVPTRLEPIWVLCFMPKRINKIYRNKAIDLWSKETGNGILHYNIHLTTTFRKVGRLWATGSGRRHTSLRRHVLHFRSQIRRTMNTSRYGMEFIIKATTALRCSHTYRRRNLTLQQDGARPRLPGTFGIDWQSVSKQSPNSGLAFALKLSICE